ncbi:unnamed protein product [Amoebophrya sp. A120]|nr:unnamed protein product [Amoebophrya sp. A120]|eukprot:GSA120T00010385001.1
MTTSSSSSSKKKVDARVRQLLEHCVKNNERSFFVILGDRGRDQIVNLQFMLNKLSTKKQQQILWCYKKELGFSSNRKTRAKELKKKVARGDYDANIEDPFELFTSAHDIRYCYYKDSEQVLGKTHQMLILQDFEALTPNILCRTVETVSGGGAVILLLNNMSSLRQLYNCSMDIHKKFSSELKEQKQTDFEPRWNERFLLSLVRCDTCLVLDDEMNLLPICKNRAFMGMENNAIEGVEGLAAAPTKQSGSLEVQQLQSKREQELLALKEDLKDAEPLGSLLNLAKTLDQAQALMQFVDVISEKTLSQTVSLTAGRGRGKSASLGLALAAALAYGYSNIFVSAPSPENLTTVFEFLLKGFDALGYTEHKDYDVLVALNNTTNSANQNLDQSSLKNRADLEKSNTNQNLNLKHGDSKRGNIVRVNVFKNHRQTIQYIPPEIVSQHGTALSQAEMLIIDEAAAIPLPIIKQMLGPYLTLMSSTVNGYEGTGRSLSLKLLQDLKHQKKLSAEIELKEPIRYCLNDAVEAWLNELCLLDASESVSSKKALEKMKKVGCPMPDQCELFLVDRTALFSYHGASEKFLKKLTGLFVASHYKNSPNDLILLSDAPGHYLFVLLAPSREDSDQSDGEDSTNDSGESDTIPEILVAMHVATEGALNKEAVANSLARGLRPSGDMISWTISQQFSDANFGSLKGARIVRIATHPQMMRQGYGQEAVSQFIKWCNLEMVPAGGYGDEEEKESKTGKGNSKSSTAADSQALTVKEEIPALLSSVQDTKPVFELDWLGTSFGVTLPLFEFWHNKLKFDPIYIRQTANDVTGEHSGILLRRMGSSSMVATGSGGKASTSSNKRHSATTATWLAEFHKDFRCRFLRLLKTQQFQKLPLNLALSVAGQPSSSSVAPGILTDADENRVSHSEQLLNCVLQQVTRHDLHRIELFANKRAEVALIQDLLPVLASLYFDGKFVAPSSSNAAVNSGAPATNKGAPCNLQLSAVHAAILLAVGCQQKTFEQVSKELQLPVSQTHALFTKLLIRVWSEALEPMLSDEVKRQMEEKRKNASGSSAEVKKVDIDANIGGQVTTIDEEEAQTLAEGENALLQFGQKISVKKRIPTGNNADKEARMGKLEAKRRKKNKA